MNSPTFIRVFSPHDGIASGSTEGSEFDGPATSCPFASSTGFEVAGLGGTTAPGNCCNKLASGGGRFRWRRFEVPVDPKDPLEVAYNEFNEKLLAA